jgi:hypothetical protein
MSLYIGAENRDFGGGARFWYRFAIQITAFDTQIIAQNFHFCFGVPAFDTPLVYKCALLH